MMQELHPYEVKITIQSGENFPVRNQFSGTCVTMISVGGKRIFKTTSSSDVISPSWSNQFCNISVPHLKTRITLIVCACDKESFEEIGMVELDLSSINTFVELQLAGPLEKIEGSNIVPDGLLQYKLQIKKRTNMFEIISSNNNETSMTSKNIQLLVDQECTQCLSSVFIRRYLTRAPVTAPEVINWSHIRDLIRDATNLDQQYSSMHVADATYPFAKAEVCTTQSTRINAFTWDTCPVVPPIPLKHALTLCTSLGAFSLGAVGDFDLWAWVGQVKDCCMRYQLKFAPWDGITYLRKRQFLSNALCKESISKSNYAGQLKLFSGSKQISCNCTLTEDGMVLTCVDTKSLAVLATVDLKRLLYIIVSSDFAICKPFDIQLESFAARIGWTGGGDEMSSNAPTPSNAPGNADPTGSANVMKGGSTTGADNSNSMLKQSAKIGSEFFSNTGEFMFGAAGSAMTVVQSTAQSTLKMNSWTSDSSKVRLVINAQGIRDASVVSAHGETVSWDEVISIPLGWENVQPVYYNSHGALMFLTRGGEILGEKYVLYKDLASFADIRSLDHNSPTHRGGGASDPMKVDLVMDEEISLSVHVYRARDLLPGRDKNGLRNPFVEVQLVRWNGESKKDWFRKASKPAQNTLDPEWNEMFMLRGSDGLGWAKFVRLVVKDKASVFSSTADVLGIVDIPIEDFVESDGINSAMVYRLLPEFDISMENCDADLGTIEVVTRLVVAPKQFEKNFIPPTLTLCSHIRSVNTYNTRYLSHAISSANMSRRDSVDIAEKYNLAPCFDGLYLYDETATASGNARDNASTYLLSHFHTIETSTVTDRGLNFQKDVISVRIFENQRNGAKGFCRKGLLATDRANLTDESGTVTSPYDPKDKDQGVCGYDTFRWDDDWTAVVVPLRTDGEGWCYGEDFGHIARNYRLNRYLVDSNGMAVRRRCWMRTASRKVLQADKGVSESKLLLNLTKKEGHANDEDNRDNNAMEAAHFDQEQVHYFENQRRSMYFPFEFGSGNLSKSLGERSEFSDESGLSAAPFTSLNDATPPDGFEWDDTAWRVDRAYTQMDDEGWSYGLDFSWIMSNYKNQCSVTSSKLKPYRRRKWIRKIKPAGNGSSKAGSVTNDDAGHEEISQPIALTRKELYKQDKVSLLRLCAERNDLLSPIFIPWEQVIEARLITSSILAIKIICHRYIGEMRLADGFTDNYAEVQTNIFVENCPAEDLLSLFGEKIECYELRNTICQLVSSGSMSGVPHAAMEHDDHGAKLSLGSQTIQQVESKIAEYESILSSLATHSSQSWAKSERLHILRSISRLQAYVYGLVGTGLDGPQFDTFEVSTAISADLAYSVGLYGNNVQSATQAVTALLGIAETRIRDISVCGWNHYELMISILKLMIHEYFVQIISHLGRYFDVSNKLKDIKEGNQQKFELINFFIQNDKSFANIINRSLRFYNLCVTPSPILSSSLDLLDLVHVYGDNLVSEMLFYSTNVMKVAKRKNADLEPDDEFLPWLVAKDKAMTPYCSHIPADTQSFLMIYLDLSRIGQSELAMGAVHVLEQKIKSGFIACYVRLAEEYKSTLCSQNWAVPTNIGVGGNSASSNIDVINNVRNAYIPWLCSVANDSHIVLNHQVKSVVKDMASNRLSEQDVELLGIDVMELEHILKFVITNATEALSCVIFGIVDDVLPSSNIYSKWTNRKESEGTLIQLVFESLDPIFIMCKEHLFDNIFIQFMKRVVYKMQLWYLFFLKETSESFHKKIHMFTSFSKQDCIAVTEDCNEILEFLNTFLESYQLNTLDENSTTNSDKSFSLVGTENVNNNAEVRICINQLYRDMELFDLIGSLMVKPMGDSEYCKVIERVLGHVRSNPSESEVYKELLKTLFQLRKEKYIVTDVSGNGSKRGMDETELSINATVVREKIVFDLEEIQRNAHAAKHGRAGEPHPLDVVFGHHKHHKSHGGTGSIIHELLVNSFNDACVHPVERDAPIEKAKDSKRSVKKSLLTLSPFSSKSGQANDSEKLNDSPAADTELLPTKQNTLTSAIFNSFTSSKKNHQKEADAPPVQSKVSVASAPTTTLQVATPDREVNKTNDSAVNGETSRQSTLTSSLFNSFSTTKKNPPKDAEATEQAKQTPVATLPVEVSSPARGQTVPDRGIDKAPVAPVSNRSAESKVAATSLSALTPVPAKSDEAKPIAASAPVIPREIAPPAMSAAAVVSCCNFDITNITIVNISPFEEDCNRCRVGILINKRMAYTDALPFSDPLSFPNTMSFPLNVDSNDLALECTVYGKKTYFSPTFTSIGHSSRSINDFINVANNLKKKDFKVDIKKCRIEIYPGKGESVSTIPVVVSFSLKMYI